MPSFVTHSYFMQDIYDKLDSKIKKKIIIKDAKIFSQGPDIFYFYNMCVGRKSKKYSKLGNYMHKHNVNLYFENIVNYIKENNLENDKQCLSFLYGSIAHFVLDSIIHPFIFYKTGVFIKGKLETYKYSGLHQEMEYYLDAYMIFQNEKKEAKNFKIYKKLYNIDLSNNTLGLIKNVIKDTYDYDNIDKIYKKCVRDMKKFYKYFKHDHYGIKKSFYTFIHNIIPKKFRGKRKSTFYLNHNSKKYYLNLEKNEWNHPSEKYEFYNYSFIELYIIALEKAYNIINEIDMLLENHEINNKKIDNLINNLSYITGKDCENRQSMKYFEF